MRKNKLLPYLYAGLFLFVIVIILVENSYLLINQTSSNITETSWLDAEKLINSIVAGAKQSIESVQLTDQQILRHVRKLSGQIDRLFAISRSKADEEFRDILRNFKIVSFSVHDQNGKQLYSLNHWALPTDIRKSESLPVTNWQALSRGITAIEWETDISKTRPDLQMLSFPRSKEKGVIRIFLGNEKLQEIRARIGLQLLINKLENQNVIQTVSFLNDQLMIIADYEPSRINTVEEKLDYFDALKKGVSYSYNIPESETVKSVHPILLTEDSRGVFVMTFRRTGIKQIYSNTAKITITNSIIIMLLASISAIIMLIFHKRNITRMEIMEKKISENAKLVSLANLTAGVAHEVRNPLNSISITIQRLQMEYMPSGKGKQEQNEYMALTTTMKKEVDRINTIITDFLDFAKPFSPNNECFNLDEFISENISFFSGEALKLNVQIDTTISTNQAEFFGDREKLTQVLVNLFLNALEATPDNGSILIVSDITKHNNWQLKIQDSGEGIADQNINHIFDIYFTTKKSGSGLGLYISRKIIQAHGGSIELRPNPTKGTTAIITLPIKAC